VILALIAWAAGYVIFILSLSRDWGLPERADAIVVLTGGTQRLDGAVALLESGRADRLFISGVNEMTTKEDIRQLVGASPELFACCVEIGYTALDTIGNAQETSNWVRENQFETVIVVTANYHMPRTLLEFKKALDGTDIHPFAVESDRIIVRRGLFDPKTALFLAGEYNKYLISAVRLGLNNNLD